MVGSLIRLVDRKFRMEMECVQQAMELILDILLYRIVHRSIWISFSNCFPSDSYLFSFNHRRGFAKMTEFAAFFFRNPLRGSFLSPRDRKQTLLRKNIFLLIALVIADSKVDSHTHVIVYDDSIVQKKKKILQFYFVIYTFYCLVLHRKKKINKQASLLSSIRFCSRERLKQFFGSNNFFT